MKKLVAILLTLCILLSATCITVSAASGDSPKSGIVMRVSGERKSGKISIWHEFDNFVDGWNYAMRYSTPDMLDQYGCKQVIVDIYTDWKAVDGEFSEDDGYGFKWDTIYIPEQAVVTINLNGHAINRGLTDWEYNGEVISIEEEARVTINGGKDKDDTTLGSICGGYSANGGGGIHASEGSHLTLNYVEIRDNKTEDDNGSGIYLEEGSTLIAYGGSISGNLQDASFLSAPRGCGLYTEPQCTVRLDSVRIRNNNAHPAAHVTPIGVAIFASGDISMKNCAVSINGISIGKDYSAHSVLWLGGTIEMTDCEFVYNGELYTTELTSFSYTETSLFYLTGNVKMTNCTVKGNKTYNLIYTENASIKMRNCSFVDNKSPRTMHAKPAEGKTISLDIGNCTFNNNGHNEHRDVKDFLVGEVYVNSWGNSFGDSTFDSPVKSKFTGSIFVNTSPATVISLVALAISIGAIILLVIDRKTRKAKKEE